MAKNLEAKLAVLEYKFKQEKRRTRQLESVVEKLGEHFSEQISQIIDALNSAEDASEEEEEIRVVGFAQSGVGEEGEEE